ncbi:MAG: hypothetical protein GXP46_11440 [Deferribacteres bacterium]|nr:hypothetical protein [Deferribacteres bacterium]
MNRNMKISSMVIFALCVLSFYGCATGTKLFVDDQYMGDTPAVVCLERDKTYKVTLQKGENENVMNIHVTTDTYKPVFFGVNFFVEMENGAVVHGTETVDEMGNLNFQRNINISIPQNKDSVVVKFLTEEDSLFEIINNEEFMRKWFSACKGNDGGGKIPRTSPFLAAGR